MKIGLRCPEDVTSVAEATQYALVARKGGGRFWLNSARDSLSTQLGASLLGSGFNLPLGIVAAPSGDGRQTARQAAELALLSRQKVVVAWNLDQSTEAEAFMDESATARAANLLDVSWLRDRVEKSSESSLEHYCSITFGQSKNSQALAPNFVDYVFLDFEVNPMRKDAKVIDQVEQLGRDFHIGSLELDRVHEQEFVIGALKAEAGVKAHNLLFLENMIDDLILLMADKHAEKARELFSH